jgi:tetratricopeptide (TPR) repeat protein
MGEMQLASCEMRASLAGYRSDSIPMFNIRPLNRNDIGTIILHYFGNVQGLTTSATSALAPKDAKKAFERATKAIQKNDPDTAQKELLKAVQLHPRYAEAWFQLGKVYERREHKDEAKDAYKKSIAADGNFVNPYERLFLMAAAQNEWEEALTQSDKVIRLNPFDFPGAYYVNAVANYQLKKFDAAEKSARESAKLTGKQVEPRSHYVLGLTLAQKGDFSAASDSLKTFLKVAPAGANIEQVQKILGDLDKLMAGKR